MNILRGGNAAQRAPIRAGRVLSGRAGADHGEFSAGAVLRVRAWRASWAAILVMGPPSGSMRENGGFPPFPASTIGYVARRYVARRSEGRRNQPFLMRRRLIANLATGAAAVATLGVGSIAGHPGRAVAPFGLAGRRDHPRRADESGPQAAFRPCRLEARPCGVARRLIDVDGVGGDRRTATNGLSGERGGRCATGQGAIACLSAGGNAEAHVMRAVDVHVN